MKIYKTQAKIESEIVDGVLTVNNSVKIECDVSLKCSLVVEGNIKARNISAWDINAWNIKARDIKAGDINAGEIKARDIYAWNINARNINARDINFWAVCFAYVSLKCRSIVGRRKKSKYFCLDSDVVVENK